MTTQTAPHTIAVTGATGYVGRFVVAKLLHEGAAIRALVRPDSDRSGFNDTCSRITWITGYLHDRSSLTKLVEEADAVVHLAYEHVPGRYRGGEGDDLPHWLNTNLIGSLNLISAASEASVRRFIFLSSRAVFSRTEANRLLDEKHPTSPDTHYGAYKASVEAFLHSYQSQSGMKTYSVRATGVYGKTWPIERSKWWSLIADTVQGRRIDVTGGGTEVYGGDLARVIWALISRPTIAQHTFHVSDRTISHAEVVRIAKRSMNMAADEPMPPIPSTMNPLECTNLSTLEIRLGGVPQLERTIQTLVRTAKAKLHTD